MKKKFLNSSRESPQKNKSSFSVALPGTARMSCMRSARAPVPYSLHPSIHPPPRHGTQDRRELTGHVDVLLAGEPDARVELPHHVLVLAALPDVLHQARVVQVGAVEADAEGLPGGGDRPGAEGLHHFAGPLAPVAGGESRHGQEERQEVEGESQRRSPAPVNPHVGAPEVARSQT